MCRSIFIQSLSSPLLLLVLILVLEHLSPCRPDFDYDYEREHEQEYDRLLAGSISLRKIPLSTLGWWNWQTRTFEGRMPKGLRVQVPPRALPFLPMKNYLSQFALRCV